MLCLSVSQHFIRLSKHSCKLEELSSEPHLSTTGLCHDRLATLLFLAFACADPNKLWEILREMGIPDHPACLLRNLYAGQGATVRTGTTDWFQIGKGVRQGYILSPCLFNLYSEDIMRNAGLEETQAGVQIAGRNRYADDTTLMAESEEELKSFCYSKGKHQQNQKVTY